MITHAQNAMQINAEQSTRTLFAKTRKGRLVEVGTTTRVEGGWRAFTLGTDGYAVETFIPE